MKSIILLFGMPRSGTTWLAKIFDSHPDTLYRHEPDGRGTLNSLPLFPSRRDAEQYRHFLDGYIAHLPDIRDEKISASLPLFRKHYYTDATFALRRLAVFAYKLASHFFGRINVPDFVDFASHDGIRLVWKSIESLGRLGVLTTLQPDARCVIIIRHPCGYVSSVQRGESIGKFEAGTKSSNDWGIYEALLELPAAKARGLNMFKIQAMSAVERLALKWSLTYEHVLSETEGMENVLVVRYEDICADPLGEMQRSLQHCHLPFAKETEAFLSSSTSQSSSDYYGVFKIPLESAWKWRKQLTPEDAAAILRVASGFRAGALYPE
ncbi:MAG: sulfotransferase [Betaproteobacteria bacterium]|nr:sulfotransferase [Betaproteobacteria bacterium]